MIARWQAIDQCSPPSTAAAGVGTTALAACSSARAVELGTIDSAGHQWPGGKPSSAAVAALLGLDQPSTALNAKSVIWAFFAAHPKA